MAPPLSFLERKWAQGRSNTLVDGATQQPTRRQIPSLEYDTHLTVSKLGRITLMNIGRFLYWNCDTVRGTVNEIARLCASTYIPQYYGRNKQWGSDAEAWLYEHDKFCSIRGWPYTMDHIRRSLIVEQFVDGDHGILLTERNGIPKLQTWRAHRIGCRANETNVDGGPFDGARIIDGVILDEFGMAIGYRLLPENQWTGPSVDVSARDFLLNFIPDVSDQIRGLSIIGLSVFNWQDSSDTRKFELLAQKIGATYAMQVFNETGEVDRTKQLLQAAGTSANADGSITANVSEQHDSGRVMYFRAGSGQKIEPVRNDRPSANSMAFLDEVIRSALEGMGWSFDYQHNPTKIGGAPLRVVVSRINRRVAEVDTLLVRQAIRRIDGWRISKAIKNGDLPGDVDWFKWDYQRPKLLTADAKYDSDVDQAEVRACLKSAQDSIAQRGNYWEDVQDANIAFEKRLAERCATEGVNPDRVRMLTPNGNGPAADPQANADQPNAQDQPVTP